MTSEYVNPYAARKAANEASREWATRDGHPWAGDDDVFLLENWIQVDVALRDEVTVSQCLERTIEACRVRCEHIRKALGIGTESPRIRVIEIEVCTRCWMARAANGSCGCEESTS